MWTKFPSFQTCPLGGRPLGARSQGTILLTIAQSISVSGRAGRYPENSKTARLLGKRRRTERGLSVSGSLAKADVGSFDQHGRSPMDLAIDEGNEEAVLELRAAGAAWDVSWQAALRRAVRSQRRNCELPGYLEDSSESDSERVVLPSGRSRPAR